MQWINFIEPELRLDQLEENVKELAKDQALVIQSLRELVQELQQELRELKENL